MSNPYYPVFLDLNGRRCLVFGGNHDAEGKVNGLLLSQAKVEVIAWDLTHGLKRLADAGTVTWHQRGYRRGDLAGASLAIVADTSNPKVSQEVNEEAERYNCLVNVMDVTHLCNWIAPAIVRRGPVIVAVSTGGASPALARRLREGLELSPQRGADCCIAWSDAGDLLGGVRTDLRARGVSVPNQHWQDCMTSELLATYRSGRVEEAREQLVRALEAGVVSEEVAES